MPRTFNTPNNQAKKRKIITVVFILIISVSLIIYQFLKSNQAEKNQNNLEYVSADQDHSTFDKNDPNYYPDSKDAMILELQNQINELQIIFENQNKRIEELEKKNSSNSSNPTEENIPNDDNNNE